MIGGIDIQLPTMAGDSAIEVAIRVIRQCWPQAVFENGISGERYNAFWDIPLGVIEELFVYQESKYADAWDDEGAVPKLSNTMIHLIPEDDMLTVVIDQRDQQMNEIISAIASGLRDEILFVSAEAVAA